MRIEPVTEADVGDWLTLRQLLFPEVDDVRHEEEAAVILGNKFRHNVFLCRDERGEPLGFAEVSLRQQVDGCRSSPVGYLEGVFVVPGHRRQGVARGLMEAAEDWVRRRGCREFASDTGTGNETGRLAHERFGFEVVEEMVLYRKTVVPAEKIRPEETPAASPHAPVVVPAFRRARRFSGWTVVHAAVGAGGLASVYLSDLSSTDPMAGAIYPMLAAVCVIYIGTVFAVKRYRTRTDERNRGEGLFTTGEERD